MLFFNPHFEALETDKLIEPSLRRGAAISIEASSTPFPHEIRLPSGHRFSLEWNNVQDSEAPKFKPTEFKKENFQNQIEELLSKLSKLHPFYLNASEAVKRNGYQFKIYSEDDSGISKKDHDAMKTGASAMADTSRNLIFIRTNDLNDSLISQQSFVSRLTNELFHATLDVESKRYSEKEAESLFKEAGELEKAGSKEWSRLEKDLFAHMENELASSVGAEALVDFLYDKTPISITAKSLNEDTFFRTRKKPNYLMGCLEVKFGSAALKKIEDTMRSQEAASDDVKALLSRFGRRLASTETEEGVVRLLRMTKVIN